MSSDDDSKNWEEERVAYDVIKNSLSSPPPPRFSPSERPSGILRKRSAPSSRPLVLGFMMVALLVLLLLHIRTNARLGEALERIDVLEKQLHP